ncbi:3-methyladenine DNA glycosylase [Demequina lignilytica]|uniref:3-methyladenine DNA glycosylase n=1 Tax=Demequina lignilytica TaxID=3051663 RepID=A0AB35MFI3_9MICO|nr:3-methyladenine DNA glycosylase [Demequina sp. SYSU T0a273]MDN4482526.1 3-methyladenine DNA glycosylase [Demequina sp. SYSU T0a273]
MTEPAPTVLTRAEWEPLARAHSEAADALTAGHRERAGRAEKHAIEDFLFEYYGVRPSRLRRWHPGLGIVLEDAPEHARWTFYRDGARGTQVDVDAFLEARGRGLAHIVRLLEATASRPARYGCFGLHEWAMVYRAGVERRHPLPLRLGQDGTDAVVEANPIACSHIDAFRFFTPEARPLNQLQPTRETQVAMEQPGCLHATMDLYKWAAKLTPVVPSSLTLEAFALALEVRQVDMQASPYDVSRFGLEAIAVETPDGKREYARRQREFAERGGALRARLLEALSPLAHAVARSAPHPRAS